MVRAGKSSRPLTPAPGLINGIVGRLLLRFAPTSMEAAEVDREALDGEILPIAGKVLDVIQPFPLQGERAHALLQDIQKLSAALDTNMTIEGDIGVIRPQAPRTTHTPDR